MTIINYYQVCSCSLTQRLADGIVAAEVAAVLGRRERVGAAGEDARLIAQRLALALTLRELHLVHGDQVRLGSANEPAVGQG